MPLSSFWRKNCVGSKEARAGASSKAKSRQRKKKRRTLNISILCDFYAKTRRKRVLEHVLHSFSQIWVWEGKRGFNGMYGRQIQFVQVQNCAGKWNQFHNSIMMMIVKGVSRYEWTFGHLPFLFIIITYTTRNIAPTDKEMHPSVSPWQKSRILP